MKYNDNNTRTYARSSVLAFPKTTDYACSLEIPCKKGKFMQDAVKFLGVILVVSFFAVLIINSGVVK